MRHAWRCHPLPSPPRALSRPLLLVLKQRASFHVPRACLPSADCAYPPSAEFALLSFMLCPTPCARSQLFPQNMLPLVMLLMASSNMELGHVGSISRWLSAAAVPSQMRAVQSQDFEKCSLLHKLHGSKAVGSPRQHLGSRYTCTCSIVSQPSGLLSEPWLLRATATCDLRLTFQPSQCESIAHWSSSADAASTGRPGPLIYGPLCSPSSALHPGDYSLEITLQD